MTDTVKAPIVLDAGEVDAYGDITDDLDPIAVLNVRARYSGDGSIDIPGIDGRIVPADDYYVTAIVELTRDQARELADRLKHATRKLTDAEKRASREMLGHPGEAE